MIAENYVASDEVTINAPAQLVWDVIVDFENYNLWNEFCPGAQGILELGQPLTMQVDMGNGPQEQVEYFTTIDAPRRIVWSMENKPADPIHADRAQVITPIDEHSCTYITIDEFSGEAMPAMMEAFGEVMERGFNLCARGLKARAETLYRERRA